MTLQRRQPGSTIKPFIYLAAMDRPAEQRSWTPATLIWDVPTTFDAGAGNTYEPKNYDDRFHGPTLLRPALGNSYNIPAVKALEYVGLCDFLPLANSLGLQSLSTEGCDPSGAPSNYGLSLALGGGEISPLEMAQAYATEIRRFNAGVFDGAVDGSQDDQDWPK